MRNATLLICICPDRKVQISRDVMSDLLGYPVTARQGVVEFGHKDKLADPDNA